MRLNTSGKIAVVAVGLSALVGGALVAVREAPTTTPQDTLAPNAHTETSSSPTTTQPHESVSVPSETIPAATITPVTLECEDQKRVVVAEGELAVRLSAAKNMSEACGTAAIPTLLAVDYAAEPWLAAPVLEELGDLGKRLPKGPEKDALAKELADRIATEKTRVTARESLGNIVILLETLAEIGSAAPVSELCSQLESFTDPVIQDSIVFALGEIGDPSGAPCVRAHLEELEKRPFTGSEDHDLPLREGRKAARETLAKIEGKRR